MIVSRTVTVDRRIETAVLRAVAQTDVPSPNLRWADLDGERLGRPALLMDLAPGVCDAFALNGALSLERRVAIAHRLYDRLADIRPPDRRALGRGDARPGVEQPATESVWRHPRHRGPATV